MDAALALFLIQFSSALKANTSAYKRGDKSKDDWYADFLQLLAMYLMLAWMLGQHDTAIEAAEQEIIAADLNAQVQYLEGFAETIDTLPPDEAEARSELYAASATQLYWKGFAGKLVLPAYPGDGSSECGQFDKCAWRLVWLDRDKGHVNAYWELGEAEHCPTCEQRATEWSPLKVRNWKY